jgi:hypothetical protein
MARPYFRQVPNFDYVSRTADNKAISDYIPVKNLFKKGKLRSDIFGDLNYFTKYQIIGDERPDNVAYKFYEDETLDWVILLSNNILNIQTEWPLPQTSFDSIMIEKYGSYTNLNATHHYETVEVKNVAGTIIVPQGLQVPQNFSVTYYDASLGQEVTKTGITREVTNLQYEEKIEDEKRNIFILKPIYLNIVFNDLDDIMPYKKGGTQYVNATLKKGDNIRLYQ